MILSSHSFHSFICSAYLSGMSNDCWLFCRWGVLKFCVSGYWFFCGWGCLRVCGCGCWVFWGHIYGWFCISLSQSSLCSSSFLQMGQCGPHEHFSVACLGITMAWGIAAAWGGSSVLIVGAAVVAGVGGIGQSFLVSSRFSDVDPELGQGVVCLGGALGISSSGGGLDPSFWSLVVGCGTSANCPIANLYTVTSIDSAVDLTVGVWVLKVPTVGWVWLKLGWKV